MNCNGVVKKIIINSLRWRQFFYFFLRQITVLILNESLEIKFSLRVEEEVEKEIV